MYFTCGQSFSGEFWLSRKHGICFERQDCMGPGSTQQKERLVPVLPASISSLHFPCFNTCDQPDRNQSMCKRKKNVTMEPRNTACREEAVGIKCEERKALGSKQISWKMGRRARVYWVSVYEPLLCSAQTTPFSEH